MSGSYTGNKQELIDPPVTYIFTHACANWDPRGARQISLNHGVERIVVGRRHLDASAEANTALY